MAIDFLLLTIQDDHMLVFHEEEFQLPMPSQVWEMIENATLVSYFLK